MIRFIDADLVDGDRDVRPGSRPFLPGQRVGDDRGPAVPAVGRAGAALAQPAPAAHLPRDAGRRELLPQRRRRGAPTLVLHHGPHGPLAALQHTTMRSVYIHIHCLFYFGAMGTFRQTMF